MTRAREAAAPDVKGTGGNLKRDQAQNGSGDRGTICDRDERAGRACTARSLTCCRPTSAARAETLPPPSRATGRGATAAAATTSAPGGASCAPAPARGCPAPSRPARPAAAAAARRRCYAARRRRVDIESLCDSWREPAAPRSGASPSLDAHAAPALSKSVRGAAVNAEPSAMQMRISPLSAAAPPTARATQRGSSARLRRVTWRRCRMARCSTGDVDRARVPVHAPSSGPRSSSARRSRPRAPR